MSVRTTVVLVVILAGLAAYLVWIEPRTGGEAETEQAKVYTVSPEQVVGIEVQSGEASVRLEREAGGAWRFADRAEPVDQLRLQSVSLTGPTVRRTLEGVSDLGQYGLDPPQARVRLKVQDGSEIVLHLGNRSPDASGRYLQRASDGPVYLVDDFWAQDWLRLVSEPPVQATPTPSSEPAAEPTATP